MNVFQRAFDAVLPSLLEAQDALFSCDDPAKKQQWKETIDGLKAELARAQMDGCTSEQWENYQEAMRMASKPFVLWQIDFARVFREKGGFDIVIGNPPYVGEKGNKEIFRPIAATGFGKNYYYGKMDLFYFFFHKALDLGSKNAEVSFITTNYYPTAFGGKVLREDFKKRTQIRKLINFNELKIFESALGQHNMITLLTKDKNSEVISHNCICKVKGVASNHMLDEIMYAKESGQDYFDFYEVPQSSLYEGDENYIRLAGFGMTNEDSVDSILTKIAGAKRHLKDIAYIKQGIVSGADKYTDAHEGKYHLGFPKGMGIFVLHKPELDALTLPANEMKYVKEVYKNSQISPYHIAYTDDLKVFYITKETDDTDATEIIRYLRQFKPILESKREAVEGKLPWYSLHWARDRFIFEADEKIVNSRRAKRNIFAMDTKKCFEQSDLMITVVKDEFRTAFPPKYVLALLNSKLYYLWLRNKGKLKGDMLEMYGAPLEEIPLKEATTEEKKKIISLVNQLLSNPNDQSSKEEIDKIVYQIYGLTEKEIEITEEYDG